MMEGNKGRMSRIEEMKQMIRNEVQSINSLEERVAFKELMEGVFLSLYEANEEMYRALEERVMDDLSYDINRYLIRTGLVERAYLDKSHHVMTAMREEDMNPPVSTAAEIRKVVDAEGKFCLTTIFLQCDALEVRSIFEEKKFYTGILKAGTDYSIKIQLEPSKRYLNQVEDLYHLFMKNGIPWQTVNAPYLFKMADVVITKIPEELPDHEHVTNLFMDFGDYNAAVRYDMIPIWNVQHLMLDSVGFPIPCGDYENYEHVISIRGYGKEHAYLVDDQTGIKKVRQSGEKLMVTGKTKKSKKWDIYMIRRGGESKIDRYHYPMMENVRKEGFAERFQRRGGQMVKTKGELERFIWGMGLEDYIEYQSCMLTEPEQERHETYAMNFFMEDEIRDRKGKKQLTLYFKAQQKETWLLRDMASFILSEVQELYPEYECGGKLV